MVWKTQSRIHKIDVDTAIAVLNRLKSVVTTVQTIRGLVNNARVAYIRQFLTDLVSNIELTRKTDFASVRLGTHCFSYVTSEIEAYAPPLTTHLLAGASGLDSVMHNSILTRLKNI